MSACVQSRLYLLLSCVTALQNVLLHIATYTECTLSIYSLAMQSAEIFRGFCCRTLGGLLGIFLEDFLGTFPTMG